MKYLILLSLLVAQTSYGSDLSQTTDKVCEKIKVCGTEQLKQQGLSSDMIVMMQSMIDNMCVSMVSPYVDKAKEAGLEDKSVACLELINSMSCADLMANKAAQIPQCQELEAAANEAGLTAE